MQRTQPTTVEQYLAGLPTDRRAALAAVRKVILDNLHEDCVEGMAYGMIGYAIPHSVYPPGYHCNPALPLPYAGLASQKGHMSLYLTCHYTDPAELDWFRKAWAKTGRKLDMGKSCIRFKRLEDLALEVIGEAIRRLPPSRYIEQYEAALGDRKHPGKAAATAARKSAPKKAAPKKASTRKASKPSGAPKRASRTASTASRKRSGPRRSGR